MASKLVSVDEVFEQLIPVQDPEHPVSITDERMKIVTKDYIKVNNGSISVRFKPTVPYCPMGGLIGILIRHRLESVFPDKDIEVLLLPGSHSQEAAVNAMISDDSKYTAIVKQLHERGML